MNIQKKLRIYKKTAISMVFLMVYQIVFPTIASALTSGPTQPEVQGFEPVGTTQMVDPFTGDFNYNIPLFDLPGPDGGYPFNLAYHAGITMDQEASWVGLGWSLNPGAITRNMRGLPDEFNGDKVKVTQDIKTNHTISLGVSKGQDELFGFELPKELSLNLGLSLTYNNYRGLSASIDPSLSIGIGDKGYESNLGLSFNTNEATALSLGMGVPVDGARMIAGLNLTLRAGLDETSLGFSTKGDTHYYFKDANNNKSESVRRTASSSGFTFSRPAYTPNISMPWLTTNFSGNASTGPDAVGFDPEASFSISYTQQRIRNKDKTLDKPAYGYLHLDNHEDDHALLDFNREKDGTIFPQTPNLASPSMTYDIYSVVGQGIGTVYRPSRSDVGIVGNEEVISLGFGGGFGLEGHLGGGTKGGFDIDVNFSKSKTGKWSPNSNIEKLNFISANDMELFNNPSLADYEKYYFQSGNEMTAESPTNYDKIGNQKPVRLKLKQKSNGKTSLKMDETGKLAVGQGLSALSDPILIEDIMQRQDRKARTSTINPITNKDILKNTGNVKKEVLGINQVKYYNGLPPDPNDGYGNEILQSFDRTNYGEDHFASFEALQPNGARYVYGLSAYNTVQEEYIFSVDMPNSTPNSTSNSGICGPSVPVVDIDNDGYKVGGTDKYKKKTEIPKYAHSHLLTSVLGADYIDITNDGPTDDDYGYWVKFNYVKTTTDANQYEWRAPFFDASFIQGTRSKRSDDKGSFNYGKRDQYYLATAETKTHIAEFILNERKDALGASDKIQDKNTFSVSGATKSYLLKEIRIYSKLEKEQQGTSAIPMKTVVLEHNYNLCRGVYNHELYNPNLSPTTPAPDGTGKLTLEKIYFTYGENDRGKLSPYVFDYNENDITENPDYNLMQYDKWGMYKPTDINSQEDICKNQYMPYVEQFQSGISDSDFREDMNQRAAVWNLKSIVLPSGANMEIDYEIDDYGYEQNRVATQMFNIKDKVASNTGVITLPKGNVGDDEEERKIYFEVNSNLTLPLSNEEMDEYFADLYEYTDLDGNVKKQIFFKILIDLKRDGGTASTTLSAFEFVEGYANVEDYGFDSSNNLPYVVLEGVDLKRKNESNKLYHPFSVAAWQQLKVLLPDNIYSNHGISEPQDDIDGKTITRIGSALGSVFNVFKGYYGYCINKDFGRTVDIEHSFIKLNTPSKKKLGGGIRVKKITIDDNWIDDASYNETKTVGQVFDYTTTDEDGSIISSGVLTKEPAAGGEESALRYAKIYPEGTLLRTKNNFFFEGPVNESYFPGSSVGYSKVTMKSLATEYAMNGVPSGSSPLPEKFGTTGFTVNEFFTAKDFPVITTETDLDKRSRNIPIPIPFASIHEVRYIGSQGYAIELNDMHGKPYRVTHYGLDENNNPLNGFISQTEYVYFDKEASYQLRPVRKVVSNVPVLLRDDNTTMVNIDNTMEVGVDYEFFTDMRLTEINRSSLGGGTNINILGFIFPSLTFFPRASDYSNITKTAVTNKVIRKKGILKQVKVRDGSSEIVTENKLFDPLTGGALLTTVHNEYNDIVYNYSLPARWTYDGMGAAYKNLGMRFTASGINGTAETKGGFKINDIATKYAQGGSIAPNVDDYLVSGDEFIVLKGGVPIGKTIFMEKRTESSIDKYIFDLVDESDLTSLPSGELELYLIRSGRRNHVGAAIASITSKSNPLENRKSQIVAGYIDAPNSLTTNASSYPTFTNTYKYQDQNGVDLQDVLSANAIVFKDSWSLADNEGCSTNNGVSGYSTGEKGIWRPYKTYAYLTDRKAGATENTVDLRTDGTYQDFVMFNWTNPFFDQSNGHGWKMMSEATLFNKNGHGLESRDALGHYSCALYGYKDNLSTAVAANARYHEIAFDGFEEYSIGDLGNIVPSNSNSSHLDIVPSCASAQTQRVSETHSIVSGIKKTGNNIFVVVNREFPYDPNINPASVMDLPSEVTLNVSDQYGKMYTATLPVSGVDVMPLADDYNMYFDNQKMLSLKLDDPNSYLNATFPLPLGGTIYYTGQATLHYQGTTTTINAANNKVKISEDRAHTGKQSLFLPLSESGITYTFSQNTLRLQKNKKYIFSAWVSEANIKQAKFKKAAIMVNGVEMKPTGRIIEGWQRVEGEFTANGPNMNDIEFYLSNGSSPSGAGFYVDDIRVFPKDGGIQTYVYNPTNYRLKAVLDANNYATFYVYDAEGNLIMVRKETKEGLVTVQEARSHMIKTNDDF